MTYRNAGSVIVLPDLETVSGEAAGMFARLARASIASRGRFTAALSGGSTPHRFYEILSSDRLRNTVEWKNVHLFWADERMVPPDHTESNYRLASEAFLSAVSLPQHNIHRIEGERGAEAAAAEYEKNLREFFGGNVTPVFDLIVLGTGADGHTASLFPGSSALDERERLAVPVPGMKGHDRVTLTLPVLNNARSVLFLASGTEKADALREIIVNGNRRRLPAGLVQPAQGSLRWLLDREAAAGLSAS